MRAIWAEERDIADPQTLNAIAREQGQNGEKLLISLGRNNYAIVNAKPPVRVAVTGAAGQIGYSLLFRIAANECRNLQRTQRRRRALQDRLEQAEGVDTVRDHADDVSGRIDDERRMRRVREALADLPSGQREAIELVVWEGLGMAEAAAALGVAEGTVKSRVSRARKRLGEILSGTEEETR